VLITVDAEEDELIALGTIVSALITVDAEEDELVALGTIVAVSIVLSNDTYGSVELH
jgi:hypothetical protein